MRLELLHSSRCLSSWGRYLSLNNFLVCVGLTCVSATASTTIALDKTSPHYARPADLEGREWKIASYLFDQEVIWPHHEFGRKGQPYISFKGGVVEGSLGCGQFAGKYRRSGGQLTISAEWTDGKEEPCSDEGKHDATQIVKALSNVRRIRSEPEYWHEDALLLTDAKGAIEISLLPMQAGKDLSELQDTFWHLVQLQGSRAEFSGVVTNIQELGITFGTSAYAISFPFQYKLVGLEFSPASSQSTVARNSRFYRDRHTALVFESDLHKIGSYELSQGDVTFFGKDRQPTMVLSSIRQEGIENRRWHIARYRGDGTQPTDAVGLTDAKESADITFLNGRVEGTSGCGAWSGTYKLSGDQVTVEAGTILAGLCSSGGFAQGPLVEKAFKGELRMEEKADHISSARQQRESSNIARAVLSWIL